MHFLHTKVQTKFHATVSGLDRRFVVSHSCERLFAHKKSSLSFKIAQILRVMRFFDRVISY